MLPAIQLYRELQLAPFTWVELCCSSPVKWVEGTIVQMGVNEGLRVWSAFNQILTICHHFMTWVYLLRQEDETTVSKFRGYGVKSFSHPVTEAPDKYTQTLPFSLIPLPYLMSTWNKTVTVKRVTSSPLHFSSLYRSSSLPLDCMDNYICKCPEHLLKTFLLF